MLAIETFIEFVSFKQFLLDLVALFYFRPCIVQLWARNERKILRVPLISHYTKFI